MLSARLSHVLQLLEIRKANIGRRWRQVSLEDLEAVSDVWTDFAATELDSASPRSPANRLAADQLFLVAYGRSNPTYPSTVPSGYYGLSVNVAPGNLKLFAIVSPLLDSVSVHEVRAWRRGYCWRLPAGTLWSMERGGPVEFGCVQELGGRKVT